MTVLVVGVTGALRPAALELVSVGEQVVGLARRVHVPGVEPLEVDFTDVIALLHAIDGRTFDAALLYCPSAPLSALRLFEHVTTGRVVELLTSASVRPPFDVPDLAPSRNVRVVLGWTAEGRWHTPREISDAALLALRTGEDSVLGVVRPWSGRPG